jgi:hypothetical protein
MDPYTMAAQMLGDMPLTNWQVAELRAIDRKYQQHVYTLLHRDDGVEAAGASPSGAPRAGRELTAEEVAELRARVTSDILAMLTPEQRRAVDQR